MGPFVAVSASQRGAISVTALHTNYAKVDLGNAAANACDSGFTAEGIKSIRGSVSGF